MGTIPLEPDEKQMREILGTATELVVSLIRGLPDATVMDVAGAEQVASGFRGLVGAPPVSLEDALTQILRAIPKSFNTASPGFMAYIPGGGLFLSAVADLIANTANRYTGMWASAPALVQVESDVIRWMADLFEFPAQARGILTTGGSMANFSALVTARVTKLGEDFQDGVIYVTEHTHASVAKAARLAGFPGRAVRTVATDGRQRIDLNALSDSIRADRADGRRPTCVVGSAGTTNTGAIDPLVALADLAAQEALWLHVDAAYGGFFQLTEHGRAMLRGIERADSITLDPHKGMFLPYGTGALLVRDGRLLREAHTVGEPHYMQDIERSEHAVDLAEYSPELTRDFRGLRVWLPLRVHGPEAFGRALQEKLTLTGILVEGVRAIEGLQVVTEPELTVFSFAVAGVRDPNEATRAILDEINASGRIMLSSTVIDGRFVIRPCIVSHRTHRDRIDEAIEIIGEATRKVLVTR